MIRNGLLEAYNNELLDSLKRGAQVRVTKEEMEDWLAQGNKLHFIGHHCVLNPASKSTPVRKVSDSSMKNNFTGPSLNQCIPKGPNALTSLLDVLFRWRTYKVAIVLDLSKAYHSVHTGVAEKFLRLEVWRWGDETREWEVFGYVRVAFGDLIASLILEIAKLMASELGVELGLDDEAARKLIRDFYVDDGVSGSDEENAKKLIGNLTVMEDGKLRYDGTFSEILALAGFKPKAIIRSGENHPAALEKLGRVLGHDWSPLEDTLTFQYNFKIKDKNPRKDDSL